MGVLVAAGMMGGLALYLANISRQQHVTQRKAETGAELTGLHHRIIAVLYDGDACLKTLGEGSVLQNGPVAELLNKGGTPVVKTGEEIKRVLVVEKMEIQNITGTGQTKEAELKVKIKKLGVANAGMITERVFGLTVELDSAGKISRCHHTLDSKEHGIKTAMCTEMGGEMVTDPSGGAGTVCSISGLYKKHCESLGGSYTDPPGTGTTGDQRIGTCDMNPPLKAFCESMGGSYTGPSATGTTGVQRTGTCDMNPPLQAFCESLGEGGTVGTYTPGTPVGTCKIDDIYVNLSGDTMTGDLGTKILNADSGVFSGNISAGGTVSAGGTGSGGIPSPGGTGGPGGTPISPGGTGGPGGGVPLSVSCGAGQVLKGISNGTAVCESKMADVSCGSGKVMTGITNGVADCEDAAGGGGGGAPTLATLNSSMRLNFTGSCPSTTFRNNSGCVNNRITCSYASYEGCSGGIGCPIKQCRYTCSCIKK